MSDPAVKRKVIIYPKSRDVDFEAIKQALLELGRVRGGNPLGNGGWLLRMSRADEAEAVLSAAKKGKILIAGDKVDAQRPSQGAATDANRIPIGGPQAKLPFRKGKENKRQRACTVIVARIKPSSKDAVKRVLSVAKKVGEVKSSQGPLSAAEIAEEQISLSQIEGRKVSGEKSSDGIILLEFGGVAQAFAAVKSLHGKAVEGLSRPLWARQLGGEGAKIKYWRIIIRNLPFSIDENKLKTHMSLKNTLFVWDAHIPKSSDGKARGFGFIGYICRSDAEKAIKALNGTKLGGRTIVLDWTIGKKEFQEGRKPEEPEPEAEDKEADSADEEEEEGGGGGTESDRESLSEEGDHGEGDNSGENKEGDEAEMLQRIISSFQANSSEKDLEKKSANRKESSVNGLSNKSAVGAQSPRTNEENEEALTRTVFVSQVPLNAFRIDVQRVMEKFGQVTSCRMVMDKQTRKFSGKAFVEYSKPSFAKKASTAHEKAKAGKCERLAVNGHLVNVYLALNKNGIQGLSDMIKKKTNRPDKRNLYLADEGYIDPQSDAAQDMSEGDLKVRERSREEKLFKLRNPNMFVSDKRLLIRNLPSSMKKGELRQLCVKAVKDRATKSKAKVVQCKIVYEGRGEQALKSTNRGFIEFAEPSDAMACLRQLNNNPEIKDFSLQKRPIVEFAIEDSRKVSQLKHRETVRKEKEGEKKTEKKEDVKKERKEKKRGKKEGEIKEKAKGETVDEKESESVSAKTKNKSKKKKLGKAEDGSKPSAQTKRDTTKKRPNKTDTDEGEKRVKKAKKAKKPEPVDKLDTLINDYQSKYFSSGEKKNLKRWFE